MAVLLVSSCKEEPPPPAPPPGVSSARQHLYPYVFTADRTFHGTRVLTSYLEENPVGQDALVARWLLIQTYGDALTHALVLDADEQKEEAAELRSALAHELKSENHVESIAKAIVTVVREGAQRVDDQPLQAELDAALLFLDGLSNKRKMSVLAPALATVAEGTTGVAHNARLVLAAETLTIVDELVNTPLFGLPAYLAARYPYPCPEGFLAYASGADRSLEACEFICPKARGALAAAAHRTLNRGLLIERCGPRHYGFVDVGDAVYISHANFVFARILTHMSTNLTALEDLNPDLDQFVGMHTDVIGRVRTRLSQLSLPAEVPVIGPYDGLELPLVSASSSPTPGLGRSVTVNEHGLYVNLPTHMRVEREQVFLPEVLLRYRYPGRLAVAPVRSFELGRIDVDENNYMSGLMTALDELERDRARVTERLGDLMPGAIYEATLGSPSLLTRSWLLADRRVGGDYLRAILRTLAHHGERDVQIVTWDSSEDRPAGVDLRLAPVGLREAPVIELGGASWSLVHAKKRANGTSFDDGSVAELAREVAALSPGLPVQIVLRGEVNIEILARVAEIAATAVTSGADRPAIAADTIAQKPAAAALAADRPKRVVTVVESLD